jgi:hypothetical protein
MSSIESPAPQTDSPNTDSLPTPVVVQNRTGRWWIVVASLLGTALGWWVLETQLEPFPFPEELTALSNKRMAMQPLTPEETARLTQLEQQLDRKNGAAGWAVIGLPIVAFIGLTAGAFCSGWKAAFGGLIAGAVVGSVGCAGAGWLAALLLQQLKLRAGIEASLAASASQAIGWSCVACATALVGWLACRGAGYSPAKIVLGGIAGAIIAMLIYPLIAAFAFPMNNTELVIPSGHWNRLAWTALAGVCIAIGMQSGMAKVARSNVSV